MRKVIISATVAVIAAVSFAAPSQAGGFSIGFGHGHHGHHGHHHGGSVSIGFYDGGYYGGGYYEPSCYIKKVKRWDKWGNLRIKKIRICD
ncbi:MULTISPECIES: hypothetical protein [unclassified Rhizobium]|uniref:hypothetical protein n=1 Tax=unclassified Rhizobium TaxID=2613769 RepID=UPI000713FE0A|nr:MULTISPECIES: hypothetical protein [unclassified Rhizobium]KQS98155.1 hypothetical protein ASG50_23575 [Rhizobium sp. Leaf386]KQT97421.1 hypothetical protein ASG68_10895 [Rhizobium sp. Leaf453]